MVFWAPSTTRISVSAARATMPRLRCSHAFRQWVARRGRCVRVTASTRRARAAATTRMFPQRHVPTANSRRIGAALGDAGCNSAASTAIKPLCLRDLPRILRTNYAAEAADVFLVRLQTLAQLFFHQPAAGVSARQQLISTTASKPLIPRIQRCCAGRLRGRDAFSLSLIRASEAPRTRGEAIDRARCPRTRPAAGPAQRHPSKFQEETRSPSATSNTRRTGVLITSAATCFMGC